MRVCFREFGVDCWCAWQLVEPAHAPAALERHLRAIHMR